MKGIRYGLFCAVIFVLSTGVTSAQNDSIIKKLKDSLNTSLALSKKLQSNLDSLAKDTVGKPAPCVACVKDITNSTQLFLVYAPFALLLLFTIIFIFWINRSNFTLEDALSITPTAKQYEAAAKANAALAQNAAVNNQPALAVPDPQPQRSTSRLLAFITGVTAILIAICLVSYYAYAMFAGCGNDAQLNALWKILMGLGIGIIPYGINVWNGNPKEQPVVKP